MFLRNENSIPNNRVFCEEREMMYFLRSGREKETDFTPYIFR